LISQIIALRLVCAELATAIDLLQTESARSRKLQPRTTQLSYRPRS
jgi:hypothetical protein